MSGSQWIISINTFNKFYPRSTKNVSFNNHIKSFVNPNNSFFQYKICGFLIIYFKMSN
jgi:hypothetical protein